MSGTTADQLLISSGGSLVSVDSHTWEVVQSVIYPSQSISVRGLTPQRVLVSAQAGDPSIGLELVLEDNTGRVLAGPSTTFGGSVPQLTVLSPFRASAFPTRSTPSVLILKARNRKENGGTSFVSQMVIECDK